MTARVFACLLGEWIDITEGDTLINSLPIKEWLQKESPFRSDGLDMQDLLIYQEKVLNIPFVRIFHKGKSYCINPIFLQLVY